MTTRGVAWDPQELQMVCRAYRMATENRINGADQTTLHFGDSIVRYLTDLQPRNLQPTDLRYANRVNGRESILRNLKKKVFLDIQKFQKRLLSINNKLPTGNPSETDIHCMAIAYHLGWSTGLDYSFTTSGSKHFNPATTWKNYLAYLEVRHLPKFDICPHRTIVEVQNARVNNRCNPPNIVDSDDDDIVDNAFTIDGGGNDLDGTDPPIDNNAFLELAAKPAGSTKTRGARGMQKAKVELIQHNQVQEGLTVVKDVRTDIAKITNNVVIMRHAMAKKHDLKKKAVVITLLKRKYDGMKDTNPVEAKVILKKINQKCDEQLQELENDGVEENDEVEPIE